MRMCLSVAGAKVDSVDVCRWLELIELTVWMCLSVAGVN